MLEKTGIETRSQVFVRMTSRIGPLEFYFRKKPLDLFPHCKTRIRLPHPDFLHKSENSATLDDSGTKASRYTWHFATIEQISSKQVMVCTIHEKCHSCRNLNGAILEGRYITTNLKGSVFFQEPKPTFSQRLQSMLKHN